MGTCDQVEHPLATQKEEGTGPSQDTPANAPNLSAQKKVHKLFRKKQDRLKSEPYFEPLLEKIVRETAHTFTVDSEKIILKFNISLSLGEKLSEPTNTSDSAGFESSQHTADRLE